MRKIRWGVLGTAHIAEGQTIPGMQNTKNCELYAIAGRSLEKAKEFQNRFHLKCSFRVVPLPTYNYLEYP